MHNIICVTGVYPTEITKMVFVCQVSCLVENFSIRIFSGTIKVIMTKHCLMVLLIEAHLFVPLSVTSTCFQVTVMSNSFNEYATIFHFRTTIFHFRTYLRETIDMFSDLTKTLPSACGGHF